MSTDKMRSEFEATIERCGDVKKFIGNRQLKTGCLAYFIHGWQAALSQSEPAQVSQTARKAPVFYADKTTINGFMIDPYSRQSVIGLRIGEYVNETDIPLYLAPPDYEALKWKYEGALESIRYHAKLGHVLLAENEALKLRVAELEAESRTKHEYAMQMLGERDRLQSECDRSKQRVLELEGVARDSLNALIYHTGQTRPIERTEENIKAIRKTLWEN